jgi:hypothetical protein
MEPVIAQIFGLVCGIDSVPSLLTLGGWLAITYSLYRINIRDTLGGDEKQNILSTEFQTSAANEGEMNEDQLIDHIQALENKINTLKKDFSSIV